MSGRMFVVCLALGALLMLSACSTVPTSTVVEVPVPVSCLPKQIPQRPEIASPAELRAMAAGDYVLAVSADRLLLLAYAGELEAAIKGCR